MLVLTRRVNQVITIGDPASPETTIEITIADISGGDVRIGITAPHTVSVDRREVWESKQREQADRK